MNKIFSITLTALLFFASCKTQKQTIVDPREDINTAIIDCINLLEQKDYESLLSKYVHPDDLKRILEKQSISELSENFSKKKAGRLLNALKIAQGKDIEYIEDGTKGLIKLGESDGPDKIVFRKKDKFWYISD